MFQTLSKRLSVALILCFSLALAQAAPLKLRLLATTDIHMNLVNYDYYQDKETEQFGLAKTATLIKTARIEGGGNFAGLDGKQIVFHAPDENREVLGRYMASEKTVNPNSDNNWQILPVTGVSLRFQTGAGAMRYLSRHPGLKLVSENSDGSVTLELVK